MNWQLIDYKHKKAIDKLPVQCKKKYAVFKYVVQASGIDGLGLYPGFKLEILKGKLSGLYSIRLNIAYRVIFDIKEQVRVIKIIVRHPAKLCFASDVDTKRSEPCEACVPRMEIIGTFAGSLLK